MRFKLDNRVAWALILSLILIPAGGMRAEPGTWVQLGPEGATVFSLAIDPSDSSIIYAGTEHGAVYRSNNAGLSWRKMGSSLVAPLGHAQATPSSVNSVVIDPSQADIAYAGTSGGVYKWNGVAWELLLESPDVQAIAIHPTRPDTVYAGGAQSLLRSRDGGQNWELAGNTLLNVFVSTILVDPLDPEILYIGGPAGGTTAVWKSTNGGASWQPIRGGLPIRPVECLALAPSAPDVLYVGLADSVFKSTDGGESWSATGWLPAGVGALSVDPGDPNRIFAGLREGGLYRSLNGGDSWERVDLGPEFTPVHSVMIDSQEPDTVYAGVGPLMWSLEEGEFEGGVYKSTDGGLNWQVTNSGLHGAPIYCVATGLGAEDKTILFGGGMARVYTGFPDSGFWETAFLGGGEVDSLAVNPKEPNFLYASALDLIYKSSDGSSTWDAIWHESGIVRDLVMDRSNSEVLYAGTDDGVVKTTRGGSSWLGIDSGLPRYNGKTNAVHALAIDPKLTATVYAGTLWAGVYKSTNGGMSWYPARSGLPSGFWSSGEKVYKIISCLAVDPHDSNVVYAGTGERSWPPGGSGIYRSTDGGASWQAINSGLPLISGTAYYPAVSLEVDPVKPGTIYTGIYGSGIFKSTNRGDDWEELNQGLNDPYVWDVALDPRNSDILYAATEGGGISILYPDLNSATLIFPQFASGGETGAISGSRTRIMLTNNSNQADTGSIHFFDAFGGVVHVPIVGEIRSSVSYAVEPWGSIEIETDGTGPLRTGVIEVISDLGEESRISGVEAFEIFDKFVSVSSSAARPSQLVYVSVTDEENTGVALYNPAWEDLAVLELVLTNSTGREEMRKQLTLEPRQQIVRFVTEEELFEEFLKNQTEEFRGTLEILVQDGPAVAVLGLLQESATGALVAVSTGSRADKGKLIFPQFLNGEIESVPNRSRIVLINGDHSREAGYGQFQDRNGNPSSVPFSGMEAELFEFELEPKSTLEIETEGSGQLQTGVVEVISDRGGDAMIQGAEIFDVLGNFVSVPNSTPRSSHRLYLSVTTEENTGFALYNPDQASLTTVALILIDSSGQERARKEVTLQPRQQLVRFVTEEDLFADFFKTASGDFRGSLNILVNGKGGVSVLGLLQKWATGALMAVPSVSETVEP